MNTSKDLEPVFNGLLRKGINPEKIGVNAMFLTILRRYLEGNENIITVLDVANKINILAGGKYNEKAVLEA